MPDQTQNLTSEQRADAAERALQDARVANAVERAARDAGFEYPELVARMIDGDAVRYDPQSGKVEGAEAAVAKLAKAKPGLVGRLGPGTPQRHFQGKLALPDKRLQPPGPQQVRQALLDLGDYPT